MTSGTLLCRGGCLSWDCFAGQRCGACEAARANTMTGGQDLSCGFPRNGKIPYPHQATWSQPINIRPVRKGNLSGES